MGLALKAIALGLFVFAVVLIGGGILALEIITRGAPPGEASLQQEYSAVGQLFLLALVLGLATTGTYWAWRGTQTRIHR